MGSAILPGSMEPVNADDLEWRETEHGETHFRRKQLSGAAGGEDLGCSLYELPPGGKAWPFHWHTGNAEALYVLAGEGHLRTEGGEHRLRPGDYAALPTGEGGAHRVVNDRDAPLRYLMMSTMRAPDVTVYPDSDKIGVYGDSPPGGDRDRTVDGYFRRGDAVDYWLGEE